MSRRPREKQVAHFPLGAKAYAWGLAAVLAFSLGSKLFRLSTPQDFYFDEVYHGFTATRYLHGDVEAYNPWAKNPPGKAMEWTHPPLAKLLMTGAMEIFGENSFGWRVGSVVSGTAAVGLTAGVALEVFGSTFIALLAAALLCVEGMAFAHSRIAMNDSYFVAFALFAVFFYIRWKKEPTRRRLYLTGIGLGLASATKWTALYLFAIVAVDLGRDIFWESRARKLPLVEMAFAWGVLPVAIYILSYAQLFILKGWGGGGFDQFLTIQEQMWYYHTGLHATHPYMSKPWQWLLNLRPIWMYGGDGGPDRSVVIYDLGNSVVLLSGLVAVGVLMFREKRKSWARWFVLLAYFLLWAPWLASPRIMLFYHYLPAVPFLCIILAWYLDRLLMEGKPLARGSAIAVMAGALLWFCVTYPHLTALPVPRALAEHVYYLIPSWR